MLTTVTGRVYNVDMTTTTAPAGTSATIEKIRKLNAAQPTSHLVTAILTLEAQSTLTAGERRVIALLAEEVEARHPEVSAALEAWADDVDADTFGELTYGEALLAALPAEAIR